MDVSLFIVGMKREQHVTDKSGVRTLKRYSRGKYQDEKMRGKARKELEEWEEKVRRQKNETEEQRAPRLTMSVVMQSRASFSNGKAAGVDGISAEVLKTLPWRAL